MCSHKRVKNTYKNGESPFSFYRKTKKGQFRLPVIILCDGTEATFKTTPFLPGRIIKNALKSIRTTKGAIITSF